MTHDNHSKFFAASIDQNIEVIDLHDCANPSEALDKLERELFLLQKNGIKYCRVVYGIGEGILRKSVLEALVKNPMVEDVQEESGSALVLF